MSRKKRSRRALINSVISLIICFSMLLGTTFAWFTDEVQTGMNTIMSGDLDVELYANGNKVDSTTELFNDVEKWEPGVVAYENLQVKNEGSLALKYQMTLNVGNENHLKGRRLSEVLKVVAIDKVADNATREQVMKEAQKEVAAYKASDSNATLANFCLNGAIEAGKSSVEKTVVIFWEPNDNAIDNLYNVNNGESASDMADHLHIDFGVNLVATQMEAESDSFGNDYDEGSGLPEFELSKGVISDIVTQTITPDADGKVAQSLTLDGDHSKAKIPDGVKLADGAQQLTFSVKTMEESGSNLTVGTNEVMKSVDVHVDGVAEDNTTPMLITLDKYLPTGLNSTSVQMYHVEDGVTVDMTQIQAPEAPDEHNEYSYDPATGDVVMALASFSEVAVVADTENPWTGGVATAFNGGIGTETDPYVIANADQFAYFRDQVDGGKTFVGEFIKLDNDIDLSNVNFDPIGWGYEYAAHNRKDANGENMEGKSFKGTFDGGGFTIYNLYQNGWDLENPEKGIDYTYTNCGFGLFASAHDATFKNLTISGADIRVECVEAGILVGLSQGNCTYENINIYDSKIANYQRPAGGVVGEVSGGGTHIFKDVTVRSDVVVGSMWGDFDTPVGGVVGARWDDTGNNDTKVEMSDVTVACKLDVYNDVTSTYQWYAYRRAGMLIGNTDTPPADGKTSKTATADFLKCSNVVVHYGDWVNYRYCEFGKSNSNWPWVRVEAGENCSAYSNPRWGVPEYTDGTPVTNENHKALHEEGEGHLKVLEFNQLYGGGQGVYGQPAHEGVTIAKYAITYVNAGKVLDEKIIVDNSVGQLTKNDDAENLVMDSLTNNKITFSHWMNAGSSKIDFVDANNTKDIVLYPAFTNLYTATFIDQSGNILEWSTYTTDTYQKIVDSENTASAKVPSVNDCIFDHWAVRDANGSVEEVKFDDFPTYMSKTAKDITIYPVYIYDGDVNLIPIDSDGDGVTNYYQVGGYSNPNGQALVKIPGSVNGIPVTEINGGAFSSYDGVHSIIIPKDVTNIGNNAFAEKWGIGDNGETITIYYAGSYANWFKIEPNFGSNWESGISGSSRIFFLNGGNIVDVSQGYLQAELNGHTQNTKNISWSLATISSSIIDEYTGYCDCSISTTGDNAHIYVDTNGNVMEHNDAGTPVNSSGAEIKFEEGGWFNKDTLTDGTNTYYRYRPDKAYWEGVTAE